MENTTTTEATTNSVLSNPPPMADGGNTSTSEAPAPKVDFNLQKEWYKALPEDLRDEPSLKNFSSVDALAKSLVHAQRAIGAEKVPLPTKLATDDDWKQFFKKIGVAEKLDDYKPDVKDEEIGDQYKENFAEFKEFAHKAGLLPKQAAELWKWSRGKAEDLKTQAAKSVQDQHAQGEKTLKSEWGDAYPTEVRKAYLAAEKFAGKDVMKILDETGLGSKPEIVKMFNKMANLLTEDELKTSGVLPGGPGIKDLQSEIDSITGNINHPYHIRNHPNHKTAVEQVSKLYERLVEQQLKNPS